MRISVLVVLAACASPNQRSATPMAPIVLDAPSQSGALVGTIHGPADCSSAIVTVADEHHRTYLATTTGPAGAFHFPDLPAGNYTVRMHHRDRVIVRHGITIDAGQTTTLDVDYTTFFHPVAEHPELFEDKRVHDMEEEAAVCSPPRRLPRDQRRLGARG